MGRGRSFGYGGGRSDCQVERNNGWEYREMNEDGYWVEDDTYSEEEESEAMHAFDDGEWAF